MVDGQAEAAGRLIADLAELMTAVQEAPVYDGRGGDFFLAYERNAEGEWAWEVEACLNDGGRNFMFTRPNFFEALHEAAERVRGVR